jgi:hypothetical protein
LPFAVVITKLTLSGGIVLDRKTALRTSTSPVNVDLAVQVVNSNFSDLAALAARDALTDAAWAATRNKTGQTDFAAGMEEARRAHPDLVDVYNKRGKVSAEVLRKLLWPIFKITNEYAQRKTEVRKYFVDESGREFRKY